MTKSAPAAKALQISDGVLQPPSAQTSPNLPLPLFNP